MPQSSLSPAITECLGRRTLSCTALRRSWLSSDRSTRRRANSRWRRSSASLRRRAACSSASARRRRCVSCRRPYSSVGSGVSAALRASAKPLLKAKVSHASAPPSSDQIWYCTSFNLTFFFFNPDLNMSDDSSLSDVVALDEGKRRHIFSS